MSVEKSYMCPWPDEISDELLYETTGQLSVFSLRSGSHSPIWASDSKINSPGWKITCSNFVIPLVSVKCHSPNWVSTSENDSPTGNVYLPLVSGQVLRETLTLIKNNVSQML